MVSIKSKNWTWIDPQEYLCCASRPPGHKFATSYGMSVPSFGAFVKFSQIKHPAQTILLADTWAIMEYSMWIHAHSWKLMVENASWWARGENASHGSCVNYRHRKKANILFTDGHAERMKRQDPNDFDNGIRAKAGEVSYGGSHVQWQYWEDK